MLQRAHNLHKVHFQTRKTELHQNDGLISPANNVTFLMLSIIEVHSFIHFHTRHLGNCSVGFHSKAFIIPLNVTVLKWQLM